MAWNRMIVAFGLAAGLMAAACGGTDDSLDAIARDYVRLTLEIGEREAGYVDAYHGPPEWAAAAKADPRTVAQLRAAAAVLTQRLEAFSTRGLDEDEVQRRAYLIAHVGRPGRACA